MVCRSINIRKCKFRRVRPERESASEGVRAAAGMNQAASALVPGGEEAARGTTRVMNHALSQTAWEEAGRLVFRGGCQLGFLEHSKCGAYRDEFSKNFIASSGMPKATHVPRAESKVLMHQEQEEHHKTKTTHNRVHNTNKERTEHAGHALAGPQQHNGS